MNGAPFLTKKQWLCVSLLFIVFLAMNSSFVWEWMYPIAYEEEVKQAAETFKVDPFLILAVVQNESNFRHQQISLKGAQGLMQLMPETAGWANEKSGLNADPEAYIRDPEANIMIGTWYLSYLLDKYHGNMWLASAAYNAGEGNVDRWLTDGIWDGSEEHIERIPFGETRHYVAKVHYFYHRYQTVYGAYF